MAQKDKSDRRGALMLGLAWAIVLAAVLGGAVFVQFFGEAPLLQVAGGPLAPVKKVVAAAKPEAPPAATSAQLFETPPGGIVPAVIPESEKTAQAPLPAAPAAPQITLPPIAGGPLIANPALMEKTPTGYLPRIADNGTTPIQGYGTPFAGGTRPRIAIVISGLGISARSTNAAITLLPPQVTLAFLPYAGDVQHWVSLARQKGHEVLLQVPMEPYDFPDSDPGQYTLRASIGEEANTQRLVWSLTRMSGYVGVTNLMGGRFLSEAGPLEPMMSYLSRRGLLFFDNGAATRSVSGEVAERLRAPFVASSVTLDRIQAPMEVERRLIELEDLARAKGSAVGAGTLYPVTVERVAAWAKGLSGRGLALAPITAIGTAKKK